MSDYRYIMECAAKRTPIPGQVVADSLNELMSLPPTDEAKRQIHEIKEAVRLTGAIVKTEEEINHLGNTLIHASYAEHPPF